VRAAVDGEAGGGFLQRLADDDGRRARRQGGAEADPYRRWDLGGHAADVLAAVHADDAAVRLVQADGDGGHGPITDGLLVDACEGEGVAVGGPAPLGEQADDLAAVERLAGAEQGVLDGPGVTALGGDGANPAKEPAGEALV